MEQSSPSSPSPGACDYKNIWGLLLVTLVVLGIFTVYLQQSLANFAFDFDRQLIEKSYQDKTLQSNVKHLYAQRVILVEGQKHTLLLAQAVPKFDDSSLTQSVVKRIVNLGDEAHVIIDYQMEKFIEPWYEIILGIYVAILSIIFVFAYFILRFRVLHHNPLVKVIDNINKLARKEDYDFDQKYTGLAYDLQEAIKLISHEIEVKDHALARQMQKWQDALSEARNQFIQARLSKEKLEQELVVRKIFEDKIEALQHHLNGIINSIPSIIVGLNHSLKITEWNTAAEQFTGVSQDKALGKSIMRVFPKAIDIIGKKEIISSVKQVHHCPRVEFTTEDGMTLFLEAALYPLAVDSSGGVVIRIDDLTTQSRLENIMVQTEKMMSVGGLAAGMAHEINNPLGGILQSAQNIQRRIDPVSEANIKKAHDAGTDIKQVYVYLEQRGIVNFIKGIRDLAERVAGIVHNMLHFSRASDSKLIPSDLSELINRTITLATSDYDLKKSYDFKRIEIYKEFEPKLPLVPCSPPELEQVLLNLVRNAAQAMFLNPHKSQKEHFMITVRTYKDGHDAVIEVEDTGPGMPEGVKEHVFEPFFTTKEVGIGTGLGLSVSNFIIKTKHKGVMSVQSEEGKGTTFTIRIPLIDKSKDNSIST